MGKIMGEEFVILSDYCENHTDCLLYTCNRVRGLLVCKQLIIV